MAGIYVASKTQHGPMWVDLRGKGYPIVSSWIDESEVGATEDLTDLWLRCVQESSAAAALVAYHRPGEEWKGAFLEIGCALGAGIPVYLAGDPPGSWVTHPLVIRVLSPEHGLRQAQAFIALCSNGSEH